MTSRYLLGLLLFHGFLMPAAKSPAQLVHAYAAAGKEVKEKAFHALFAADPDGFSHHEIGRVVAIVLPLADAQSPLLNSIPSRWQRLLIDRHPGLSQAWSPTEQKKSAAHAGGSQSEKKLSDILKTAIVKGDIDSSDSMGLHDKGIGELQFSLKNPAHISDKVVYHKSIDLYDGFPAMGIYGTPYNFRHRLVLIELPAKILSQVPESIRKALSASQTDLHITINGPLADRSKQLINNLVFHGWASKLEGSDNFNIQVPMGIFETQGVSPNSLALNSLRSESVQPHDTIYLSPNNALFQIADGRSVVSFWSVAQYKNAASVTFHIVITQEKLFDELARSLEHAVTAADLLGRLNDLARSIAGEDKKTLEAARDTIVKLLLAAIK